jgi:hypothetical protein
MGRAKQFVAAALVAVAVSGAVVVGAQDSAPPLRLCVKTGADVQAPKADGSCSKGYSPVTLSRQGDVDALAGQVATLNTLVASQAQAIASLTERVEALEAAAQSDPELTLTGRSVETGFELTATYSGLEGVESVVRIYKRQADGFTTLEGWAPIDESGAGSFTLVVPCTAPFHFLAGVDGTDLITEDLSCKGEVGET